MAATPDEIYEDLMNSADFEEVGSVEKARTFVTAAKRWLISNPASQGDNGANVAWSVTEVNKMLQQARAYVRSQDASKKVRHLSAKEGFRR